MGLLPFFPMNKSPSHRYRPLAILLVLGLASCSQYSTVKRTRPTFQPVTPVGGLIAKAFAHDHKEPLVAIGEYLEAVKASSLALRKNPADVNARTDYNFALGRVMGTLSDAKLDPWTQPLRVPAPNGGEYVLTHKLDPRPQRNPAIYEFTPADQFDVRGKYVDERKTKEGLGAPLVAVGRNKIENARENFAMERTYYGVTAVARFEGSNRCVLSFEDPLSTESVKVDGQTFPLSADFTVPLAVMLDQENPKKLELSRLLNPEKYAQTARVARLQPYDPSKQVVLCVHGLMDSPATWTPLINTLRSDPEIRKRYQFWFYSYPSGYPYQHSAAILRQQLDAIEKRFPLEKKMVIIGHSMGGMISRLMVTDTGDKVWKTLFSKPPAEMGFSPETKKLMTDALIFEHRKEISRAIFMAAPHRGADMAAGWLGRIGAKLVKSPFTLLKVGTGVIGAVTPGSNGPTKIPNSVDTLSPNNRFVKVINTIPINKDIPYHSIIGDRGKGGNKDHTKPMSSDGFVPYWSSHVDGAKSELIVPSGHSAHQNPEAIKEVRRILLLP